MKEDNENREENKEHKRTVAWEQSSTDRQTDRQTDSQTDGQTDRETVLQGENREHLERGGKKGKEEQGKENLVRSKETYHVRACPGDHEKTRERR
jgi:hypothetical protein